MSVAASQAHQLLLHPINLKPAGMLWRPALLLMPVLCMEAASDVTAAAPAGAEELQQDGFFGSDSVPEFERAGFGLHQRLEECVESAGQRSRLSARIVLALRRLQLRARLPHTQLARLGVFCNAGLEADPNVTSTLDEILAEVQCSAARECGLTCCCGRVGGGAGCRGTAAHFIRTTQQVCCVITTSTLQSVACLYSSCACRTALSCAFCTLCSSPSCRLASCWQCMHLWRPCLAKPSLPPRTWGLCWTSLLPCHLASARMQQSRTMG